MKFVVDVKEKLHPRFRTNIYRSPTLFYHLVLSNKSLSDLATASLKRNRGFINIYLLTPSKMASVINSRVVSWLQMMFFVVNYSCSFHPQEEYSHQIQTGSDYRSRHETQNNGSLSENLSRELHKSKIKKISRNLTN